MTESADRPLLEETPTPKPTKRRTPAAKSGATSAPRVPRRSKAKVEGAAETPELVPQANGATTHEEPSTSRVRSQAVEAPEVEPGPAKTKARKAAAPRKTAKGKAPAESSAAAEPPPAAPAAAAASESLPPVSTQSPEPTASAETMLPGLESSEAPTRRRSVGRRTKAAAPVVLNGESEEWSPSRRREEPAPRPAPAEAPKPPAPVSEAAPVQNTAAPSSAPAEAPAPAAAATRKYPVYIPRHVAKQMEEQGQTAPIAVALDAVPDHAKAAVEAAQAAHAERLAHQTQRTSDRPENRHEPRPDRPERPERSDRPERGGRHERPDRHERPPQGDRGPRGDRHDRGDRQDRGDRPERGGERNDFMEIRPLPELSPDEELGTAEGIVEISGKGFGFIRDAKRAFAQHPTDVFVTPEHVRRYNLRDGQWVKGSTRRGVRGAQLHRLTSINGDDAETSRVLPAFDELTVISPMERIIMETTPERNTTRLIDLFTPIGKGQRGLIVAPPRTGKTTLLQHIADALVKHHPEITLIVLLVDERPEEVTDIKRTLPSAEIMASSNDSDVKSHTRIAQLAIERAKRLVESGKDVFVLLDSITRVGRAFNNAMAGGGRTMSGGVDARALEIPRRLFAAARNTEEAGSLTIIATALIDTGSKMDELIFQEFKGTGNMEIVLDRKIADQRIYPAIDMFQSGTRREELLIPADDLHKINILRRGLAGHKPMEAIDRLLFFLRKFPTNAQMLKEIPG